MRTAWNMTVSPTATGKVRTPAPPDPFWNRKGLLAVNESEEVTLPPVMAVPLWNSVQVLLRLRDFRACQVSPEMVAVPPMGLVQRILDRAASLPLRGSVVCVATRPTGTS